VRDPEALEQVAGVAAEGDVLLDRQVREERVVLEDEADRAPLGRQPRPLLRAQPHASRDETGDRAQHRRLAGARGTDERHRLAPDLELEL
jgi:hypothetical protein